MPSHFLYSRSHKHVDHIFQLFQSGTCSGLLPPVHGIFSFWTSTRLKRKNFLWALWFKTLTQAHALLLKKWSPHKAVQKLNHQLVICVIQLVFASQDIVNRLVKVIDWELEVELKQNQSAIAATEKNTISRHEEHFQLTDSPLELCHPDGLLRRVRNSLQSEDC